LSRKIGQGGNLAWVARSLQVKPLNLLYWDDVKSEMFHRLKSKVRQKLEECTIQAAACVKNNMDPIRFKLSLAWLLIACVWTQGDHFLKSDTVAKVEDDTR
jgi:hypothetical protein